MIQSDDKIVRCDAVAGVPSTWEIMDRFGRVPFHVNPNAYTRPENYLALHVLPLCGDLGGDVHYYIPRTK